MSEFWKMTPYELNLTAEGYWKKQKIKYKSEQKQLAYQAYLISRWVWAKEVKIEEILSNLDEDQEERQEMTDEQLLGQAKVLNMLFGGTVEEK